MAGIFSHTGGETVQDMIDFLREEPSERRRPSWARLINVKSAPAGESYIWKGFLEANVYTILCGWNDPHWLWFGGEVTVED